jgi:DsbC/DsbD-like thiol-disulfide interchange protein
VIDRNAISLPGALLQIAVNQRFTHFTRSYISRVISTFALVVAVSLGGTAASAQSAHIPHGTLELVSDTSSIAPGHEFTVGLQFKMEHGWHIYWVNPGDSGDPPRITWQLPKGLTAGEVQWPAPQRMGASTIVNYVYDGDVVLMVPVRAGADYSAASGNKLEAGVKFLICSEQMCMPGKAQVSVTVPVKAQPTPDTATAAIFAAARARLPKPAPADWKFSGHAEKDSFVIEIQAGHPIAKATFFPLHESEIENSSPQVLVSRPTGIRLTLRKSGELTKQLQSLKGVLELPGGEAYQVDIPITPASR